MKSNSQRVFSRIADPDEWTTAGPWVDYRRLRSWLRHPILTFAWWRYTAHERLRRWLLPYAGEHAYRDVTDEPFRLWPWIAYTLWRLT